VVPIYTKVQSITAEPRYGGTVVMNGLDREYHSPDGIGEFLDYVKIGATYSLNIDSSQTSTRDDVWDDIGKGICRDSISAAGTGTVYEELFNAGTGKLGATLGAGNVTAYRDKGKEIKVTVNFATVDANNSNTGIGAKKATINIGAVGDY
jgi:hypothetical protein